MQSCEYCCETEKELRMYFDGRDYGLGYLLTCEDCFEPQDTGPCFDDLEAAPQQVTDNEQG